jgi:membrane protease YdiL (CAAX protease family)
MDEPLEPPPPEAISAEPPVVRLASYKGWAKLSWLFILIAVAVIIGIRLLPEPPAENPVNPAGRLDLKVLRLQLELLLALSNQGPAESKRQLFDSAAQMADGDPAKAIRVSAFAAETVGPKEALKLLDGIDQTATEKLTPDDRRALEVLGRLYRDQARGEYFHPSVGEADAEFLEAHLGWIGSLALYPAAPDDKLQKHERAAGVLGPALLEKYRDGQERVLAQANRTGIIAAVAVGTVLTVVGLGAMGLPVFLLLWLLGVVHVGLKTGIVHGGVYAETFAIWLCSYGGLLLSTELLLHDLAPVLVRGLIAMPLSLVVLAWPVLRGIPWRQVREDIGWTAGRSPVLEPAAGVACYVINLPVVFTGFVITVTLAALFAWLQREMGGSEPAPPTHPVLEQLSFHDWPNIVLFFVLISGVAPVVEETMFRGLLHRQLRESMLVRYPLLGGLCTALVVNLVFAAIHPQGLVFIPVLGALACGFSLAREWRGTLIPCMVAHGMNNFLVGLLAVFLLSG